MIFTMPLILAILEDECFVLGIFSLSVYCVSDFPSENAKKVHAAPTVHPEPQVSSAKSIKQVESFLVGDQAALYCSGLL